MQMDIVGMSVEDRQEKIVALKQKQADLIYTRKRLSFLQSLGDDLIKINSKEDRVKFLNAAVSTLKKVKAGKLPVGSQKILNPVQNEVVSLREGVVFGTIKKKSDFESPCCTNSFAALTRMIEEAAARIQVLQAADVEEFDPSEEVIKRTSLLKNKLPKLKDKPFVISRAPIVLVTDTSKVQTRGMSTSFVDKRKLERAGFKVDLIEGYVIIHDQLVVGVGKKMVKVRPKVSNGPVKTKVIDTASFDSILDSLSSVMGKPLTQVVNKGVHFNDAIWHWVMPNRDLNLLAQACAGGRAHFNDWGFSF